MRTRVMRKSNMVNFYSGHSSERNESSFEQWGTGNPCLKNNKKNLKRQKVDVLVVFVYVFKLQLTFGEKTKKQLESERLLARSIFRISVWNWEKRILEYEEFTWYGRLLYREVSKITSFHQQNNLTLTRPIGLPPHTPVAQKIAGHRWPIANSAKISTFL